MGIKSFLRSSLSNLTKTQNELEGEYFTVCSNSQCNGAVSSKTGICSICGAFQFFGKGQKCGTESKTVVRVLGEIDITNQLDRSIVSERLERDGERFFINLRLAEVSTSDYFEKKWQAVEFITKSERFVAFRFEGESVTYIARLAIFDLMISRFEKYKKENGKS